MRAVEDVPLKPITHDDSNLLEVDFGQKEYPNKLIPKAKDESKYDQVDFIL